MNYYDKGEAEIALVPVATLLGRKDYRLITDYCIGCVGPVRTVCVFAQRDISQINKIYLDRDSRTSQRLVKVLCKYHWKVSPDFEECYVRDVDALDLEMDEAILMIGDKVFGRETEFSQSYDLGVEWQKMTGLPFAFAVWIARPDIAPQFVKSLNASLSKGVEDLDVVLEKNKNLAAKIELSTYFEKHIDFHFDDDKKEAFELYLHYASQFSEQSMKAEV